MQTIQIENQTSTAEIQNTIPTVKLETLNAPSTVTVGAVTQAATVVPLSMVNAIKMRERIEKLANSREAWETTEYARSNEILYGLIKDCYVIYNELMAKTDTVKDKRRGLDDYISIKGYSLKHGAPLTAKIIRCVFGNADRRRLSTYHTVLRVAVKQHWDVERFASLIAERGGVQEISLGKTSNTLTVKQKAEVAKNRVLDQGLATVKSEALSKFADPEEVGGKAAAVLTQQADGSFTIHAIVHSDAAVNATLAAYFSKYKEELKEYAAQSQTANASASREELIDNAAKAVVNA